MRILHVNKFLRDVGGAESYMFALADMQRGEGHTVAFFGMEHSENRAEVVDAGPGIELAASIALDDPDVSRREQLRGAAAMLWNEQARTSMTQTLEDFRPDVVHMHNIYHQLSPSILAPIRRRNIATLMTLHDYKLVCPSYRLLADGDLCQDCVTGGFRSAIRRRCQSQSLAQSSLLALESRVHRSLGSYRGVDTFLCPSRFLLDIVRRAGVFPDALEHLPNFVADREAVRPIPTVVGPPTAIFIGRLSHEKGVDTLVEASRLLTGDAVVKIIGDGPEFPALEKRIAATGAPAQLLGRLPNSEARALLSDAAMMVVPSRWYENQPISVLEALSQQIPVVSTDLGGLPELVIDGVTGATVAADDPVALAAAIDAMAADPARREQMGHAGSEMIEREHSPEVHALRLTAHYQRAMDRH